MSATPQQQNAAQPNLPTIAEGTITSLVPSMLVNLTLTATAILTAPGAKYEVEQVVIDGRVVKSWKNLHSSMRAFWLDAVRAYPDQP